MKMEKEVVARISNTVVIEKVIAALSQPRYRIKTKYGYTGKTKDGGFASKQAAINYIKRYM